MPSRKSPKFLPSSPSDDQSEHSNTVPVTVVELEELTEDELSLRLQLERKVERAFYEAGKALMELRDRRLYRSTSKTFEEYCRDRFGFTHRNVNYLISGSLVVDNLQMGTIGSQSPMKDETGTIGSQILPTNERQVRPLTQLLPDQQREVWQTAVLEAGGKVPSGRIVKDVVQRIMERTLVPNPYRVGEVCQIQAKDNPDLRGKSGCWCIVSQVNEFSCTVVAWDEEYTIRQDYLKSLEYSDADCARMKEVCLRITKLRNTGNLEAAATANLKYLGELRRPYLTQLEEKLLGLLEQEYEVGW